MFAESAAPGQQEEFLQSILNDSEDSDDEMEDIPNELKNQLNKYENSDSFGRLVILSLIDHSNYKLEYLRKVFGCTKYQLDKAIALSKQDFYKIPEKTTFTRNRLDIAKCEHFLHFIFSNGLIQPCTPAETTKNGYKFAEDEKASKFTKRLKLGSRELFGAMLC